MAIQLDLFDDTLFHWPLRSLKRAFSQLRHRVCLQRAELTDNARWPRLVEQAVEQLNLFRRLYHPGFGCDRECRP